MITCVHGFHMVPMITGRCVSDQVYQYRHVIHCCNLPQSQTRLDAARCDGVRKHTQQQSVRVVKLNLNDIFEDTALQTRHYVDEL